MEQISNLKDNHLSIIKNILTNYLPKDSEIFIFGSRVTQNFKPYSDIDIAIMAKDNSKISISILASIQSDFVYSDLPYKVDVIDYNSISGKFKDNVDSNKVRFSLE